MYTFPSGSQAPCRTFVSPKYRQSKTLERGSIAFVEIAGIDGATRVSMTHPDSQQRLSPNRRRVDRGRPVTTSLPATAD